MPFRSPQQRKFLWATDAEHPGLAHDWAHGRHWTRSGGGKHKMPRSKRKHARRKSR